jgi:peroxisomal 3,2-trans-enoyl-CoA isomerase
MSGDRSKFKYDSKLIYGLHPEGILEIKIHDPKKKNSFFGKTQSKLIELFHYANTDDRVKCIVLHGGSLFSAGNDVEAFQIGREDYDIVEAYAKKMVDSVFKPFMVSLFDLEKPLIAVVRRVAVGIAFTMLCMADFVYCTPETRFFTPFMQSYQSPEGGSSVYFPKIFGNKLANEIIMQDKALSAEQALKGGFVNQILYDINPKEEYIDLLKIPCIPKLIKNNVETMVTAKRLLNRG